MKFPHDYSRTWLLRAMVILGVLRGATTPAQSVVEAWVQRYNGLRGSSDFAQKVVADSSGNVIVAGHSAETNTPSTDWLIVKYSNAGVALWTNRYNGPANSTDQVRAMTMDGDGNIFVSGYSSGSGSGFDYTTIAYSSAGVGLWTNRYNGPGNGSDIVSAIAVSSSSGNVLVTGSSTGSGSLDDYATIAYSGAGIPLWTNRYNGPGNSSDSASAVAVDGNGNIFVSGSSTGIGSGFDYATIAYSGGGLPLWTNRYNGPGNSSDSASAMAVDSSGNVLVTGASTGSGGNSDYATIAYSGAGAPLWTNRYNGPGNGSDSARALVVAGNSNVVVTGSSAGSGSSSDFTTIAYSSAGVGLWTNVYNGPVNSNDVARAVAVDGNGNIFVSGSSTGAGGGNDYATIAYSSAGLALWTNRYNGLGNSDDSVSSLAVDGNGNVSVTGSSIGIGGSSDYVTISYSSSGATLWSNRYDGPGGGSDEARAMVVDSSGNVFVTGYSYGNGSGNDYLSIAYSSSGSALWTNRYNGPLSSDDQAQAIAVDGNGNVFVTGGSTGNEGKNYATIAYAASGSPLWTNRYDAPGFNTDQAQAVVVDASGTVVVTGYSYSAANLNDDYLTIAYSNNGTALWTNRYGGPGAQGNGMDQASAATVDKSGNVLVTGFSGSGRSSSGNDYDYLTVAYSSNGLALWTNRYNSPIDGFDQAQAIAVDGSGNVFVTGYSTAGGGADYLTIAYGSAGDVLWSSRYNGPGNSTDSAQAVAVDSSGRVFVTGYSTGSGSGLDYTTIAYSSNGVGLWTNRYNGPGNGNDFAQAVAVDGSGNVFVTGSSTGSGGNSDYATIAYASSDGTPLWTNRYNGPANGNDQPLTKQSLAVGPDGSVYVAGRSAGNSSAGSTIYDFATVKYTSQFPPRVAAQPTDQAALLNSNATFTVTAAGSAPFAYQWVLNDTNFVPGATNASLTVSNVTLADHNAAYRVVITNAYGSVTSSVVNLTVTLPADYRRIFSQVLSGGEVRLSFLGNAGSDYALDRTFNLAPANWVPQETNHAGPDGMLVFTNAPNPDTNNFWRVRSVP